MAYTKQTVLTGDLITADWGNHIQTQYDAVKAELAKDSGSDLSISIPALLGALFSSERAVEMPVEVWASSDFPNAKSIAKCGPDHLVVVHGQYVSKIDRIAGVSIWALNDVTDPTCAVGDSTGNVYVTYNNAAGTKNVRKLDSSGSEVWAKTDIGQAKKTVVDGTGNVVVAYGSRSVRKLNSSGTEVWLGTIPGYPCSGLAAGPGGVIYASNNSGGAVYKFDSSGNMTTFKSGFTFAGPLAVDTAGNVCVGGYTSASGRNVVKLDPNGNEIWAKADSTTYANCLHIALDDDGCLYCIHSSKGIRKLSPSGEPVWGRFLQLSNYASGILVDGRWVYVTLDLASTEINVRKLGQATGLY